MKSISLGLKLCRALALVAGCLAIGLAAQAQTIASMEDTEATLNVGVQAEFPPWGSIDANGHNIGYDIDVAQLMADDLGVKLQLTPVTAANRVPYLTTGKVDVLAAAIGMYPERAKAVQFSKPYATLDGVIYAKKSVTVKGWSDLGKLTVGAARGSAADVAITRDLPPGTTYRRFEDDAALIVASCSSCRSALSASPCSTPTCSRSGRKARCSPGSSSSRASTRWRAASENCRAQRLAQCLRRPQHRQRQARQTSRMLDRDRVVSLRHANIFECPT